METADHLSFSAGWIAAGARGGLDRLGDDMARFGLVSAEAQLMALAALTAMFVAAVWGLTHLPGPARAARGSARGALTSRRT